MNEEKQNPLAAVFDTAQQMSNQYWSEHAVWNYKAEFPLRYRDQVAVATNLIIPRLKPSDRMLDIGCANGWYTVIFAPYCRWIDAYDLSEHLLAQARIIAERMGYKNIGFAQADVLTLKLAETYDHAMCLGLLAYVMQDEKMVEILSMIREHMSAGGTLLLKDTLSTDRDKLLHDKRYQSRYRTRNLYASLVEKAGFKLATEGQLGEPEPSNLCSRYFLFEKI